MMLYSPILLQRRYFVDEEDHGALRRPHDLVLQVGQAALAVGGDIPNGLHFLAVPHGSRAPAVAGQVFVVFEVNEGEVAVAEVEFK